jgi:hypothetical protein
MGKDLFAVARLMREFDENFIPNPRCRVVRMSHPGAVEQTYAKVSAAFRDIAHLLRPNWMTAAGRVSPGAGGTRFRPLQEAAQSGAEGIGRSVARAGRFLAASLTEMA